MEAAKKQKESKLQDAAAAAVVAPGITRHGFLVDTAIVCRVEQQVVRHARQSELRHALRGYLVFERFEAGGTFSQMFTLAWNRYKKRPNEKKHSISAVHTNLAAKNTA